VTTAFVSGLTLGLALGAAGLFYLLRFIARKWPADFDAALALSRK
jgi:hypothetical protein